MIKPFTSTQRHYIEDGKANAERLSRTVKQALGKADLTVETRRHTYVFSPPGAGKTFTVMRTAEACKAKMFTVRGAASMSAFVIQVALARYLTNGPITVWVDDCDSLLSDEASLNVLKGALDEDINVLSYQKNMTNQISSLLASDQEDTKTKGVALQSFQPLGSVGIDIPTHDIRFIITSNLKLTAPNEPAKSKKARHEQAIYDRMNYVAFDLDWQQSWGWVAHVALNGKLLPEKHDISKEQRHILLDFMWHNWRRMAATSMREVKAMAAEMVNYPNDYVNHWEARLRRESK